MLKYQAIETLRLLHLLGIAALHLLSGQELSSPAGGRVATMNRRIPQIASWDQLLKGWLRSVSAALKHCHVNYCTHARVVLVYLLADCTA